MKHGADIDGFHVGDGWWFYREDDGRVTIRTPGGGCTIPPESWASVVAFVSLGGDNRGTWATFLEKHMES